MKQPRSTTKPKGEAFLAAYRALGNISDAARKAGMNRSTHYEWLNDPDYAEVFRDSHQEACDSLRSEARRRAVEAQ